MADTGFAEGVIVCWHREELGEVAAARLVTCDPLPPRLGWNVLAVYERCPARCAGGEQLDGGDLIECSTCVGGEAHVAIGVGGVFVSRCDQFEYEIDGETYTDWRAALRYVTEVDA